MNENNIQATITLTLTREQLLTLLTSAPNVQTDAQTPEPVQVAPRPQMPMQTPPVQMPVQTPPMPETPPQMPTQQTPPVQMPTQQTPVQQTSPVQMPVQTPPVQMPVQQAQTYTVEQIGRAARPLVEGGRQQELVALLAEFGVVSVAALPEEARAAFVQRIRAMGAQI